MLDAEVRADPLYSQLDVRPVGYLSQVDELLVHDRSVADVPLLHTNNP